MNFIKAVKYYRDLEDAQKATKHRMDFTNGLYICGFCGKQMPMVIYKGDRRHTISRENHGGASANFHRHIVACFKKRKNEEAKTQEK